MHGRLRARLSMLESTLDAGAEGAKAFRDSCLAFCRALRRHHMGEDGGAFPVLRRHAPDLADVLDALLRDHEFLDPLLNRLELLLAERSAPDAAALERELAGISAVLENHLAYEERVLVSVLDRLEVDAGSQEDQDLRAPVDGIFEPAGP